MARWKKFKSVNLFCEATMEVFGDIFGGIMVMLFILGFFLMALWFILPFVIFAMKGKLDSAHILLENIERRLAAIEKEQGASSRPPQEAGERPDGFHS